jgi:phage tail sheath protein FI
MRSLRDCWWWAESNAKLLGAVYMSFGIGLSVGAAHPRAIATFMTVNTLLLGVAVLVVLWGLVRIHQEFGLLAFFQGGHDGE